MSLVHRFLKPSPAGPGHHIGNRSGEDITEENDEEHDHRLGRNNGKKKDRQDQEDKRLALDEFRILEGVIAEVGNHEKRDDARARWLERYP